MLTRSQVKTIREKLQAALDDAGVEGVEFSVGSCRYRDTDGTFKVDFKLAGERTRDEELLEVEMRRLGLNRTNAEGMTLVEYHTRKHKYPFIYTRADGKRFKCSAFQAKAYFG